MKSAFRSVYIIKDITYKGRCFFSDVDPDRPDQNYFAAGILPCKHNSVNILRIYAV
jgi:hypothetical protein